MELLRNFLGGHRMKKVILWGYGIKRKKKRKKRYLGVACGEKLRTTAQHCLQRSDVMQELNYDTYFVK